MKHKALLIATILFFLLVHTTYYWEGKLGILAMLTFLLLIVSFFVLTVILFKQIYTLKREKFRDRQRLFVVGILILTLALTFFYPGGIINFEKFESNSVLIAQQEGVANCMTTLKLRANKKFSEKIVCFGITEITGTYFFRGDTIFFDYDSQNKERNKYYKFALIKKIETKNKKYKRDFVRFIDYSDTIGMALSIVKNELTK